MRQLLALPTRSQKTPGSSASYRDRLAVISVRHLGSCEVK
uniref:Uncharacterized protein n=1 Tax=Arundo donax TaxID=35708 RepID=A0A0A9E1R8_ARUDO